jgi:RHS repeat-associated protein
MSYMERLVAMPTSYGFTGEYLDGKWLYYLYAKYYDSTVGQFKCADSVQGPNRYGEGMLLLPSR